MAERIRSIDVSVSVDTNKRTIERVVSLHEDESLEEFILRVARHLRDALEEVE